jgi:hypothetical protein
MASSTMGGTSAGFLKISTISTGKGIDFKSGYDFKPSIVSFVGLTGTTV